MPRSLSVAHLPHNNQLAALQPALAGTRQMSAGSPSTHRFRDSSWCTVFIFALCSSCPLLACCSRYIDGVVLNPQSRRLLRPWHPGRNQSRRRCTPKSPGADKILELWSVGTGNENSGKICLPSVSLARRVPERTQPRSLTRSLQALDAIILVLVDAQPP